MSDFFNQNHLQCSVNSTIPDTSFTNKMNRLVAFVSAFVVNFVFGFTLIIFKKIVFKRKKLFIMDQQIRDLSPEDDANLINNMKTVPGPLRSVSCPLQPILRRFELLQEPSTLTVQQLKAITANDGGNESESPSEYGMGGYMPVSIGQRFGPSGHYEIIRKLGWGHFSTVWLCESIRPGFPNDDNYHAVKVVKSEPTFRSTAIDEINLLRFVKDKDPTSLGYNRIILLQDYFNEISMCGSHICLTFEIMGPSLLDLLMQSNYNGLDQTGVKRIIKQVLEGLVFLHSECKIIHTDIKPENILIKVNNSYVRNMVGYVKRYRELGVQMPRSYVSALKWEEDVDLYGEASGSTALPEGSGSRDTSWPKSTHSLQSSKSPDKTKTPKNASATFVDPTIQVKIADLGNSCHSDQHFTDCIQTVQYRALEVIIKGRYSFPADIWSVACVAFEMSTGEYLFNPHAAGGNFTAEDDHLCQIWELLDGIPHYVALSGRNSRRYFNSGGYLKNIRQNHMNIWKVEDVLVDKYGWKRVDAILLADFIKSLIEPDAALRATAPDALTKKWLRELE